MWGRNLFFFFFISNVVTPVAVKKKRSESLLLGRYCRQKHNGSVAWWWRRLHFSALVIDEIWIPSLFHPHIVCYDEGKRFGARLGKKKFFFLFKKKKNTVHFVSFSGAVVITGSPFKNRKETGQSARGKERGSSFIRMCARLAIFFAAGEIFVASSWRNPTDWGLSSSDSFSLNHFSFFHDSTHLNRSKGPPPPFCGSLNVILSFFFLYCTRWINK